MMRHVSRTHRVASDWLFDRINLDPKTQIKHVDTRKKLADMLTARSFMELFSLFVQHHQSFDVFFAAIFFQT